MKSLDPNNTRESFFFYLGIVLFCQYPSNGSSVPSGILCDETTLMPYADVSQANSISNLELKCTNTCNDSNSFSDSANANLGPLPWYSDF